MYDYNISPQVYDEVEKWCHEVVSLEGTSLLFDVHCFRKALQQASQKFKFPFVALNSLIRNISVLHIKKSAPVIKRNLPQYVREYREGDSILSLAKKANYSPYLFARYIVEETTNLKGKKKLMAEAMREPETMLVGDVILEEYQASENGHTTCRLASEVREAMNADPLYGPLHDKERHIVGIEYEVVLEQELLSLGIPFKAEANLRELGTARTPDILLSCPLGVKVPKAEGNEYEWKLICWIDSKAMFGDVSTHQTSVLPQAESYVHRFGAGLILYWFGHAPLERLGTSQGEIVITSFELPEVMMWPTGELVKRDCP